MRYKTSISSPEPVKIVEVDPQVAVKHVKQAARHGKSMLREVRFREFWWDCTSGLGNQGLETSLWFSDFIMVLLPCCSVFSLSAAAGFKVTGRIRSAADKHNNLVPTP